MDAATPLSPSALEVLGALAPFERSGPHRAGPLRRFTHLTPQGFQEALAELAQRGLVDLEEEGLWLTHHGQSVSNLVFA